MAKIKNQGIKSVFLAHPVSDFQAKDGTYRPEKKQFLSKAIEALHNLGLRVECAALNEDYGKIKLKTIEFTQYDIESIKRSDILVLVTSERVTRDMYLEMGIAYGNNKPIFMFIPASAYRRHITYMILGFEEAGDAQVFSYDSEAEVPALITEKIGKFIEEVES